MRILDKAHEAADNRWPHSGRVTEEDLNLARYRVGFVQGAAWALDESARSVDVDTLADVIEGAITQHREDEEAFALEGHEDDLPPINRRHFVARAVAEWFEKQ